MGNAVHRCHHRFLWQQHHGYAQCRRLFQRVKGRFSVGKRGVAYFIAMVPTTVLLGLIGAMASTATGIANPINAFSQMVHNKVLLVATLGFILLPR